LKGNRESVLKQMDALIEKAHADHRERVRGPVPYMRCAECEKRGKEWIGMDGFAKDEVLYFVCRRCGYQMANVDCLDGIPQGPPSQELIHMDTSKPQ